MKKALLSILVLLYMVVSSGFAVEVHYCMGKRAGTEVYNTSDQACKKCGMKTQGGCCHNEHSLVKLDNVHQASITADYLPPFFVPGQENAVQWFQPNFIPLPAGNATIHPSPPAQSLAVFLANRSLRI